MANVGTGTAGKVLTATGVTSSSSFQDIGTNSGLTNNGVLIANGNNPFTATAAGTTGQVLMGNTGADPSFQDGGSVFATTYTGDSGSATPSLGNLNVLGGSLSSGTNASTISGSGSTLTVTSINTAKWIVDPTANRGTHQTITAALSAASSGQTIFIRPGTYTEDLTLKAGVNLTAFECDGTQNQVTLPEASNVTIIGKLTATNATFTAGTGCTISGVQLKTNSDNVISVSGSVAINLDLVNCTINCTNNTGILLNQINSKINLINCFGDLGTTGIAYATVTTGSLQIFGGAYRNSGSSTTASTVAAGTIDINNVSSFANSLTSSSSGGISLKNTLIVGVVTFNGSNGANAKFCEIISSTASAISVGAGITATVVDCQINSTNTNAITGLGTITYSGITFLGSSSTINTTTQLDYASGPNVMVPTGGAFHTSKSAGNTALLQAYDVDGAAYTTFGTLTANNTPTFNLSTAVTKNSNPIVEGPNAATSTDNAIVRWDGTGGVLVQNSVPTIDDTGNLSISAAVSGSSLSTLVANTSNTASATAFYNAQVAGSTAADAYYKAEISGGQAWTLGLDNSDSDAFVVSASATPGTTNIMRVSTAGEINYPLQPAFAAYLSASTTNATGDGTTVSPIAFDTEAFDQNGDFGSSIFTAPVTGVYRFDYTLSLANVGASHLSCLLQLIYAGTQLQLEAFNPFAMFNSAQGIVNVSGSALVSLTASQTAALAVTVTGGTKTVTIVGTAITTRFSGTLVC